MNVRDAGSFDGTAFPLLFLKGRFRLFATFESVVEHEPERHDDPAGDRSVIVSGG